jgi:hypothetical protein
MSGILLFTFINMPFDWHLFSRFLFPIQKNWRQYFQDRISVETCREFDSEISQNWREAVSRSTETTTPRMNVPHYPTIPHCCCSFKARSMSALAVWYKTNQHHENRMIVLYVLPFKYYLPYRVERERDWLTHGNESKGNIQGLAIILWPSIEI